MANSDRHTPEDPEQPPVPNPHRGEPKPASDTHARDAAEGEVTRPDQQEELGPVAGLMHASTVEAMAEVTNDPEAEAEAERLGVEGEGVEAAQIFTVMLATGVSLVLAVIGVVVLVGWYSDGKTIERDGVALYPELREVERVYAEMQNYSRVDSLYRIPIGAAMGQVVEAYGVQQGGAVPAPDNFSTLYLDAIRESESVVREYELDALGYEDIGSDEDVVPSPGVDLGLDTESDASPVEEGTSPDEEPAETTGDR